MATATTNRLGDEGSRVGRVATGQSRQVAGQAADEVKELRTAAAAQAGEVVQVAKQHARQVADAVRAQPSEVTQQLTTQARSLVDETRSQLETQARAGTQRVAGTFRQLGEQAQALVEGRPEEAPALTDYVQRAADGCYGVADRIYSIAEDVEARGFTGVFDDLQTFARRRPGTFLLGAVAVGFGVGRLVKAESAERELAEAEERRQLETGPRSCTQRRAPRAQAVR